MTRLFKARTPSQDVHRLASALVDLIKIAEQDPDAPKLGPALRKARTAIDRYRENHEPKWTQP